MASSLSKKNVLSKKKHSTSTVADSDVVSTSTIEPESIIGTSVACQVGSLVKVLPTFPQTEYRRGILRFMGTTDFASGRWAGIELVGSLGHNDGSVRGRRYFNCLPGQGIFVRPNLVALYSEADQGGGSESKGIPQREDTEEVYSNKLTALVEYSNSAWDINVAGPEILKGEEESTAKGSKKTLRQIGELKNENQQQCTAWGANAMTASEQPDACTATSPSVRGRAKQPQRDKDIKTLMYRDVPIIEATLTVEDGLSLLGPLENEVDKGWELQDGVRSPSQASHAGRSTEAECTKVNNESERSSDHSAILFGEHSDTLQVIADDSQHKFPISRSRHGARKIVLARELEEYRVTLSTLREKTADATKTNEGFARSLMQERDAIQKLIEDLKAGESTLREKLCIQCRESEKVQQICSAVTLKIDTLEKVLIKIQDRETSNAYEAPCKTHDIISALTRERDELREICDLQERELVKQKDQSDEFSKVLNTVSKEHTRAVEEWTKVKAALETQLQHLTQQLEEAVLCKQHDDTDRAPSISNVAHHDTPLEGLQIQQERLNRRVQELSRQLDASSLQVLQLRKENEATEMLHKRDEVLRFELEKALKTQKQREEEIVQNYEDALQQMRCIKDKSQTECISLRKQLESLRARGQDDGVASTGKSSSCIVALTKYERNEYETVIRGQQRDMWRLRGKRIFSGLSPHITLIGNARTRDMAIESLFAITNKAPNTNKLAWEAREESNYIKQSAYLSSSLLSKSASEPAAAIEMSASCFLDFSAEEARKHLTRSMFRC